MNAAQGSALVHGDGAALPPAQPRGAAWALLLTALLIASGVGVLVLTLRALNGLAWAVAAAALLLAGYIVYWRAHLSYLARPAPQLRLWAAATALGVGLCGLGLAANIAVFGLEALGNPLSIALFFAVAALPIVFYLKAKDGRRLSALLGPGGWPRFLRWFTAASAFVALLFAICCAIDPTLLLAAGSPQTAMIFLSILPFVLVQAAAEEVVFRGWLMPSIASRHGATAGLVVSSVAFGAGHVDFSAAPLIMAIEWSLHSLTGVGLGLLALRQGGLLGAIGCHTGWNVGVHTLFAVGDPRAFDWITAIPLLTVSDFGDPMVLSTFAVLIFSRLVLIWFALRRPRPMLEAQPAPV